ncbi:MAG: DUF2235 domain-containing protein [Sulfitobacter sp.]
MKRIAIFFDGTWNNFSGTNVLRLANMVRREAPDGPSQLILYCPGVGTSYKSQVIPKWIDRYGGGTFGWGLDDQIMQAYQHLAMNYAPGDQIFVFGFSRGGFAASSLVGLIRYCGLPPYQNYRDIPKALHHYRKVGNKVDPDDPAMLDWRLLFSPYVHTSLNDRQFREGKTLSVSASIAYLGVWDMVSALGIPAFLPFAKFINRRQQFHSSNPIRYVEAARHAVAIDETRVTFPVTLWDDWQTLNAADDTRTPRYAQQFFPGDHSSVGGGKETFGLAAHALTWVANGAFEQGLAFDPTIFNLELNDADANAPADQPRRSLGVWDLLKAPFMVTRPAPKSIEEVSQAAFDRMKTHPSYRPETLRDFWP